MGGLSYARAPVGPMRKLPQRVVLLDAATRRSCPRTEMPPRELPAEMRLCRLFERFLDVLGLRPQLPVAMRCRFEALGPPNDRSCEEKLLFLCLSCDSRPARQCLEFHFSPESFTDDFNSVRNALLAPCSVFLPCANHTPPHGEDPSYITEASSLDNFVPKDAKGKAGYPVISDLSLGGKSSCPKDLASSHASRFLGRTRCPEMPTRKKC
mmetsp:Transcript_42832/g.101672  ORF Transcript_42832/g.101672 Transcript_42832/m.101672 type:complete len:210 (-) Transcript_42832:2229-2858(-)